MKNPSELNFGLWQWLQYLTLCLKGLWRTVAYVGAVPTLPVRHQHNSASLKKAYLFASRINFMVSSTRFGLQSNAHDLHIVQAKLKNIFAFREGFLPFISLNDFRVLLALEQSKTSPYELYYMLTVWDEDTVYPKWADLPPEIKSRLTQTLANTFVTFDL